MSKVTFNDFYGQHVTVSDETRSGMVRIEIKTMQNLNDIHSTKKEDCDVTTSISLSGNQLEIIIGALKDMKEQQENE